MVYENDTQNLVRKYEYNKPLVGKKQIYQELSRVCSGRQWITSASTWTKFHDPEGEGSMSIETLVLAD